MFYANVFDIIIDIHCIGLVMVGGAVDGNLSDRCAGER